jgi:DNA-binding NarL/FixJ family response regulator
VSSIKVLVAEDFDPFRQFIRTELQQHGDFSIREAADGLMAVDRAREWRPDLVLIDIGLPFLNGIGAAQQIRVLSPESKIIFLTQESSPEMVQAALGAGAQAYIRKLRAHDYLLDTIDAVLGRENGSTNGVAPSCASAGHHAHFYADDGALLDSVEHFVASALMAHDAAIVMATAPHLRTLIERVTRAGVDVEGAIGRGTFRPLDAANMLSTILVNGAVDYALFRNGLTGLIESTASATRRERPRIAVFGECGALLCASGRLEEAVRLEEVGNDLLAARGRASLDIVCAYPLVPSRTDPHFRDICREHAAVAVR